MLASVVVIAVSLALTAVDGSSLLQSIPFDPFRLECPKLHGVTEVTLKMVESAGFQRQDVLFTLACDPINQLYPPANPDLDNLEREDCYWSELFDPIIDSNVNFTCSENEYLAGVSRIAFTSVQLLCCRLRTRQQFSCARERFSKPIGPDPRQRFASFGSLVSSIAIKDDFYIVKFCELTQKSIDQIKEDVPTTTSTTTTTTTTTTSLTESTTTTTTPPTTASRRTRSTTPAPSTTPPAPTTPLPTRPPKRVIVVTRPRPQFLFPPGAELPTEFPQPAPPATGPPATFDRGFPELATEDQSQTETFPPSSRESPDSEALTEEELQIQQEEEELRQAELEEQALAAGGNSELSPEEDTAATDSSQNQQRPISNSRQIQNQRGLEPPRPNVQGVKIPDQERVPLSGQQFIIDAQGQRHFVQQKGGIHDAFGNAGVAEFAEPGAQAGQEEQAEPGDGEQGRKGVQDSSTRSPVSITPKDIGLTRTQFPFNRTRPLLPIVEPVPQHFIDEFTRRRQQIAVTRPVPQLQGGEVQRSQQQNGQLSVQQQREQFVQQHRQKAQQQNGQQVNPSFTPIPTRPSSERSSSVLPDQNQIIVNLEPGAAQHLATSKFVEQQKTLHHVMKGLSSEFSPFDEESSPEQPTTGRFWSTTLPGRNLSLTEDVPRRSQERKIAEVKSTRLATVSIVEKKGSTLPPGWIPFDGIPGVSPDAMHQIDFPEFDEDRKLLPDVNYIEVGHPAEGPELKHVDNGEQSATPLQPINPLHQNRRPSQNNPQPTQLPAIPRNGENNATKQQQLPQPQLQQRPQLQQQPQLQGQVQQRPQLQQQPQPQGQPQQPPQQQQSQPQPQRQQQPQPQGQVQQRPQLQQQLQPQGQPQQPPQQQQQSQPQPQRQQQPQPQGQVQQRPQLQQQQSQSQPQLQRQPQPQAQPQQRPELQQQPQVQGLPNSPVTPINNTSTKRLESGGPKSGSEKNKGIVVFESAYKERTRKPWPVDRPPLYSLPPLQFAKLGGRFPPFDSEEATPVGNVATTQQPRLQQSTTRRTAEPDESGSEESTTTDILTFCTKEVAVKDSNRMIIACGIDEDVWQPSHCPVGSECFQVTDSTYRICCFSSGR